MELAHTNVIAMVRHLGVSAAISSRQGAILQEIAALTPRCRTIAMTEASAI